MKSTTLISIAATISMPVMGQSTGEGFPERAISIGTSLLTGNGCELGDLKCTCSSGAFIKNVVELLPTACNAEDTVTIQDTLKMLCAQAGVEVNFPNGGVASSSEPPAPTSTSAVDEPHPTSEETSPTSVTPISSTEPSPETTSLASASGSAAGNVPTSVPETTPDSVAASSVVQNKSTSGFLSVTVPPSSVSSTVSPSGSYAKSATDSASSAGPTSPTVVAGADWVRVNLAIGAFLGLGIAVAL